MTWDWKRWPWKREPSTRPDLPPGVERTGRGVRIPPGWPSKPKTPEARRASARWGLLHEAIELAEASPRRPRTHPYPPWWSADIDPDDYQLTRLAGAVAAIYIDQEPAHHLAATGSDPFGDYDW